MGGYNIDAILRMGADSDGVPVGHFREVGNDTQEERILRLPPEELVNFPAELHKFKPATPKRMAELEDSIRKNGIINPLIVRQLPDGRYQIIAGHNRRTAAMNIGYKTVRCIVMDLPNEDDAVDVMVSDNLNNRELLPSERGWGYRQQMEIRSRQGQRTDLNCSTLDRLSEGDATSTQSGWKSETAEKLGKDRGDSKNKVRRYIRLTYLIEPLLDLVDEAKLGITVGEQLSYLKKHNQETVYSFCYAADPPRKLKESHARALREVQADPDRIIDEDLLEELTVPKKKVRFRTLKIEMSKLRKYFPAGTPEEVVIQTIHTALAGYFEGKEE